MRKPKTRARWRSDGTLNLPSNLLLHQTRGSRFVELRTLQKYEGIPANRVRAHNSATVQVPLEFGRTWAHQVRHQDTRKQLARSFTATEAPFSRAARAPARSRARMRGQYRHGIE